MNIQDFSREQLVYHQSENHYTLAVSKKFLNAKDIKVKQKNKDGTFTDADVELRNEEDHILIITTIPIDIRLEVAEAEN